MPCFVYCILTGIVVAVIILVLLVFWILKITENKHG